MRLFIAKFTLSFFLFLYVRHTMEMYKRQWRNKSRLSQLLVYILPYFATCVGFYRKPSLGTVKYWRNVFFLKYLRCLVMTSKKQKNV